MKCICLNTQANLGSGDCSHKASAPAGRRIGGAEDGGSWEGSRCRPALSRIHGGETVSPHIFNESISLCACTIFLPLKLVVSLHGCLADVTMDYVSQQDELKILR